MSALVENLWTQKFEIIFLSYGILYQSRRKNMLKWRKQDDVSFATIYYFRPTVLSICYLFSWYKNSFGDNNWRPNTENISAIGLEYGTAGAIDIVIAVSIEFYWLAHLVRDSNQNWKNEWKAATRDMGWHSLMVFHSLFFSFFSIQFPIRDCSASSNSHKHNESFWCTLQQN